MYGRNVIDMAVQYMGPRCKRCGGFTFDARTLRCVNCDTKHPELRPPLSLTQSLLFLSIPVVVFLIILAIKWAYRYL